MVVQIRFFKMFSWQSMIRLGIKDLINVSTWLDFREEGGEVVWRPLPMTNILSLVQYLFDEHGVEIPAENVNKFWSHAKTHLSWGASHPAARESVHIPIGLYGDEARYSSASGQMEKLIVLTLNFPLWRPKTSRNSRWIICTLREALSLGTKTLWPLFEYISWALNILFEGRLPGCGFKGMDLPRNLRSTGNGDWLCAAKHRFALTEVRGDWSWHLSSLGIKARWNSKGLCWKCNAKHERTGGPLGESYMDFSPTAPWIQNQTSHIEFLNTKLKPGPICTLQ